MEWLTKLSFTLETERTHSPLIYRYKSRMAIGTGLEYGYTCYICTQAVWLVLDVLNYYVSSLDVWTRCWILWNAWLSNSSLIYRYKGRTAIVIVLVSRYLCCICPCTPFDYIRCFKLVCVSYRCLTSLLIILGFNCLDMLVSKIIFDWKFCDMWIGTIFFELYLEKNVRCLAVWYLYWQQFLFFCNYIF